MDIKEQIKNYTPYNKQEAKDKEMILKYSELFEDILTRKNETAHFTSSGFVLNENRDKVLMIYHNLFKSWSFPGGHADGEKDLLHVALREVKEETGVKELKALSKDIFNLDILIAFGYFKKEDYVSSHLHLSTIYLLEASEKECLQIKEDENSNVAWIPLNQVLDYVSEEHMKPVYIKIMDKAKALGLIK